MLEQMYEESFKDELEKISKLSDDEKKDLYSGVFSGALSGGLMGTGTSYAHFSNKLLDKAYKSGLKNTLSTKIKYSLPIIAAALAGSTLGAAIMGPASVGIGRTKRTIINSKDVSKAK